MCVYLVEIALLEAKYLGKYLADFLSLQK